MTDTCHGCGDKYKRIATHWANSDCSYPTLSEHQQDTIKGLLMGDGTLWRQRETPYVLVRMITKDYLSYLSTEIFPTCSGGVRRERTAKECAKRDRESGFNPKADSKDYSDVYGWQTMALPSLQKYESWYPSGEKTFPKDIELTPTVLRHYYVGDGNLNVDKEPKITLCNEGGNREKIENIFYNVGLTDFWWDDHKRTNDNGRVISIRFRKEGSENFFDYIGRDPLPGFEYKFP